MRIWDAALGELRLGMNRANFDSYLASTSATDFDGDEITVSVPNPFIRETLEQRFRPAINRALYDVLGRPCRVRLVSGARRVTVSDDDYGMFAFQPSVGRDLAGGSSRATSRTPGQVAPAAGSVPSAPIHGRVGSPLNPRYTFERFVVGNSNRLAHAAALAVADKPHAAYNPLFLYGGVGLGKTHLLHAIGHRAVSAGSTFVYVSSEAFTNDLIDSIRYHRTDEFRARYRRAGILLIDDIQFIADKERTQEEFFHTFNAIHDGGGQIVLTSDRAPKAMTTLEARLRSRFEMGLIADVQAPDLETRIAILRERRNGRVEIPDDVLELIAHRVRSNIRELEGSLNRITAYAELHGRPVDSALATMALDDLAAHNSGDRGPEAVLEAVAGHYGVAVSDIRGKSRHQRVVAPRHLAMYLLREDSHLSLPRIGSLLGGRDHTSVIHACEKISVEMRTKPSVREDLRAVRERLG